MPCCRWIPALLALVREGDELLLQDSRGSHRVLTFVRQEDGAWLAHAAVHIYLRDGCALHLEA